MHPCLSLLEGSSCHLIPRGPHGHLWLALLPTATHPVATGQRVLCLPLRARSTQVVGLLEPLARQPSSLAQAAGPCAPGSRGPGSIPVLAKMVAITLARSQHHFTPWERPGVPAGHLGRRGGWEAGVLSSHPLGKSCPQNRRNPLKRQTNIHTVKKVTPTPEREVARA